MCVRVAGGRATYTEAVENFEVVGTAGDARYAEVLEVELTVLYVVAEGAGDCAERTGGCVVCAGGSEWCA